MERARFQAKLDKREDAADKIQRQVERIRKLRGELVGKKPARATPNESEISARQ